MDLYNFLKQNNEDFDSFLNQSIQEVKQHYDTDIWEFKPGNSDYLIFKYCLEKCNTHISNVIVNYHHWLIENFDIIPKK